MKKDILASMVDKGFSTYQIAKLLLRSQTTVRYWLKKYKLSTVSSNKTHCVVCNKQLDAARRKYCSEKCRNKMKYKNSNTYSLQVLRGRKRKKDLVESRGGGCEKCGYNKCMAALDFHHHKGIKNFRLDFRTLSNMSMSRILPEFENCTVLCANCHREEHYSVP